MTRSKIRSWRASTSVPAAAAPVLMVFCRPVLRSLASSTRSSSTSNHIRREKPAALLRCWPFDKAKFENDLRREERRDMSLNTPISGHREIGDARAAAPKLRLRYNHESPVSQQKS